MRVIFFISRPLRTSAVGGDQQVIEEIVSMDSCPVSSRSSNKLGAILLIDDGAWQGAWQPSCRAR